MKRAFSILSIIAIVGALFQLNRVYTRHIAAPPLPPAAAGRFANFPQDRVQTIDFSIDAETLGRMSPRQQADQLRDWLLLSVVADADLSTEVLNQSTFDIPTIRHGFLNTVANFEYGDTRSLLLDERQVVALVPAELTPQARNDALAHIADQHRKDAGEISRELLVFDYTLDVERKFGTLMRRAPLPADQLFTNQTGYITSTVTSLSDLERFLDQADDITSARLNGTMLELGGRKITSHDYRGIRAEDVAAIWQSEQKLQTTAIADRLLPSDFEREYSDCVTRALKAKPGELIEQMAVCQRRRAAGQTGGSAVAASVPDGSGFSLDPHYDYQGLAEAFAQVAPALRKRVGTNSSLTIEELQQVVANVTSRDKKLATDLAKAQTQLADLVAINSFASKLAGTELTIQEIQAVLPALTIYAPQLANDFTQLIQDIDQLATSNNQSPDQILQQWQADQASDQALQPVVDDLHAKADMLVGKSEAIISISDIQHSQQGLADNQQVPLLELTAKLKNSTNLGDMLFVKMLRSMEQAYQHQSARYDGDLSGTEVGMVLFYTDLLAKLWDFDYQGSTPDTIVPEFEPETDRNLAPFYQQEMIDLPSTRLWFGPQHKGFQVVDHGNTLLFGRNATRLYAKSSNPLTPDVEVTADPSSTAFLGWWDDHFEEVAQYEQEYERLNQIMKWSLVIGWLNDSSHGDRLDFLKNVTVKRDNWFPDWVRHNPQLKFQHWDAFDFYPRGYKGTTTETMPLLSSESYVSANLSWTLSGGVSLASRRMFSEIGSLSEDVAPILRRSIMNYTKPGVGQDILTTLDDVTFRFGAQAENEASVAINAPKQARFRSLDSDIVNAPVERITTRQADMLRFETHVDSVNLGDLDIARSRNGFVVGWQGRDIDAGQSLALRMSNSSNSEALLHSDAAVQSFVKLPGDGEYMVRLKDADRWMKVVPERTPSATIGQGFQSRVGTHALEQPTFQLAWLDDATFRAALGDQGYLVVHVDDGAQGTTVLNISARGPPSAARPIELVRDGRTLGGQLDLQTGEIYFKLSGTSDDLAALPGSLRRADLAELQRMATQGGPLRYVLPKRPVTGSSAIMDDLSKSPAEVAKQIADNPALFAERLGTDLTDGLKVSDDLLAVGDDVHALQQLQRLEQVHGGLPDIRLRQGIAQIHLGRPGSIPELAQTLPKQPMSEAERFFNEVNRRLATDISAAERESLHRFAGYAEWRDRLLHQNLAPEAVGLAPKNGVLVLEYHAEALPAGARIEIGAIPPNATIYVQDSAGLNNLDWNVSVSHSLEQMVSGDLGYVVALPQGDIAHFNPTTVFVGRQTTLHAHPSNPASAARFFNSYHPSTGGETCPPDQPECQQEMVYVAYAN